MEDLANISVRGESMGIWVSKMTNHTFRNALVVWFVVLIICRETQSFVDTSGNGFPSLQSARRSHSRPEHRLTSLHANFDNDPPNFRDEESNSSPTNHVPWSSTEDRELTSLMPLYTTSIASVNNIAYATFWHELSSNSPLLSRRGRTEWDCRHRASQLFSKHGTTKTNRQKYGTNSETWESSPPLITDWEYATTPEPTDGSLTSTIRGFVNGRRVWFRVQEEGILEEALSNTLEGKLTTLRIPYVVANGGRVVQLGTAAPATKTAAISDHDGRRLLDDSGVWWVPLALAGAVVLITAIPMLTLPSMSPPSLNGMTISSNAPIARTLSINQQQQQQRTRIQMPLLSRRASVVRVSLTMEEQVGRQQLRVKAAETRLQNWDSDVTQQQPVNQLRKEEMKLRELNQKLATTQGQPPTTTEQRSKINIDPNTFRSTNSGPTKALLEANNAMITNDANQLYNSPNPAVRSRYTNLSPGPVEYGALDSQYGTLNSQTLSEQISKQLMRNKNLAVERMRLDAALERSGNKPSVDSALENRSARDRLTTRSQLDLSQAWAEQNLSELERVQTQLGPDSPPVDLGVWESF